MKRDLEQTLSAYVEGALPVEEATALEARLEAEPELAAAVAQLRAVLGPDEQLDLLAVDVPEVIGTAFAVQILSNHTVPLYGGVLLCSVSSMVFLAMSQLGGSFLNCFIGMLVGVMSVCFVMESVLSRPDAAATLDGAAYPRLSLPAPSRTCSLHSHTLTKWGGGRMEEGRPVCA